MKVSINKIKKIHSVKINNAKENLTAKSDIKKKGKKIDDNVLNCYQIHLKVIRDSLYGECESWEIRSGSIDSCDNWMRAHNPLAIFPGSCHLWQEQNRIHQEWTKHWRQNLHFFHQKIPRSCRRTIRLGKLDNPLSLSLFFFTRYSRPKNSSKVSLLDLFLKYQMG